MGWRTSTQAYSMRKISMSSRSATMAYGQLRVVTHLASQRRKRGFVYDEPAAKSLRVDCPGWTALPLHLVTCRLRFPELSSVRARITTWEELMFSVSSDHLPTVKHSLFPADKFVFNPTINFYNFRCVKVVVDVREPLLLLCIYEPVSRGHYCNSTARRT